MFNPSRDQVRQFFFDVWAKYRAGQPLAGAEQPALDAVLAHPEYHALLDQPERYRERDYLPEAGETNPFLHLSMHLAITEQLSVDQPPGIRERYQRLLKQHGEAMAAQHGVPGGNDLAGAALPVGVRFGRVSALPGWQAR